MVESKQVRVDNWGTFFLQRLQTFFNKTDYCDLTLQFEGNVQLKVHRLVMNACTDYFHVLEQTCEMVDDVLVMPPDLQSDVILPIVNFMYTGMLEFQMSTYESLYKTAELMDIPVLTKILDAQKSKIAPKITRKIVQPAWNMQNKRALPKPDPDLPATLPGRKLPVWKRKSAPVTPVQHVVSPFYSEPKRSLPDPLAAYDNTPKPTRFEWPEEELSNYPLLESSSFDDISYTSKQILTQDEEMRSIPSTFDEVKHLPNLNKRPASYNDSQIDIEEVKNYVKEQKIRSDLADYDDEDVDNDLKGLDESGKRKQDKIMTRSAKRIKFNLNEKENKETKMTMTTRSKAQDVNHTKIISEVLKKYPHLVKKNKNIRLKILAKSPTKAESAKLQTAKPSTSTKISGNKIIEARKLQDEGPWVCLKCSTPSEKVEFVLYYLYRKHMTDVHYEKFDSRMCKFCGHKSTKHNMLMYHQYTKHGIKPPAAYNFPKCNQCPYVAITEALLIKHKLNHTKSDLQCQECKVAFNNQNSLTSHMQITGHTGRSGKMSYDCQYCTKRYQTGSNLFSHIKTLHREEGRRDGIVSIDELEGDELEEFEDIKPLKTDKIKILSDVKVSQQDCDNLQQGIKLEPNEALNNVASGIATSLGLVDIVVLDDNQQYILQSNNQQLVTQENPQQEYILPDLSDAHHTFTQSPAMNEVITTEQHNVITQSMLNNSDIASTDELVMVLTDHDYNDGNNEMLNNDNSNIVVLYSHPVDGHDSQFITSQGNLILNSQTGMIELRNPNAVTPATGEMLNQDNTHIESIEMIQREINSHKDFKIETNAHDESLMATEKSVEHISELIENVEPNEICQEPEENLEGTNSAEEVAICAEQQQQQPMEMKDEEEAAVVVVGDDSEMKEIDETELQLPEEARTQEECMEIEENAIATVQNEDHSPISENIMEILGAEAKEEPAMDNESLDEPPMDGEDINQETAVQNEESDAVEMEPLVLERTNDCEVESVSEVNENTNQQIEEDLHRAEESVNVDMEHEEVSDSQEAVENQPEEKEGASSTEIVETAETTALVEDIETTKYDESMAMEEDAPAEVTIEKDMNETEESNEIDSSNNSQNAAKDIIDGESEIAVMQSGDEVANNEVEINENCPINEEEKVSNETEEASPEDECNSAVDNASQEEDISPIIEPPNDELATKEAEIKVEYEETYSEQETVAYTEDDASAGGQEEVVEETDEPAQTPDDKCSVISENTQALSSGELLQKETNQLMKIAILDDWEDTDSQQSDRPESKEENTVNKLITDWEEEDDETKD